MKERIEEKYIEISNNLKEMERYIDSDNEEGDEDKDDKEDKE